MRIPQFKLIPVATALFLSGFIILFPFFSFKSKAQKAKKEVYHSDSTKRKVIIVNNGDLDKAINGLNNIDMNQISNSVQVALNSINFDSIGTTIKLALESVHTDSIAAQVNAALKSIDTQKMQANIQAAMAEVQKADVQQEIQKAMKEVQQAMKEIKKIDYAAIQKEMEGAKKEMADAQLHMKADMQKAMVDIEKARTEIATLKNTLAEMKKDGLIRENEKVKLEWKDGRLFINDKVQSKAVSEKYKSLENLHIFEENDKEAEEL